MLWLCDFWAQSIGLFLNIVKDSPARLLSYTYIFPGQMQRVANIFHAKHDKCSGALL